MANVLLLRSPTENAPDAYEEACRSRAYTPVSVPVLETVPRNLGDLKGIITQSSTQTYGGVIITSSRSCEAWRAVVQELYSSDAGPFAFSDRVHT